MAITKEFVKMSIWDLIPYENNPRRNEDAVSAVIESIRQCENIDPIEVDENHVILSGHTRRLALMDEGIEETDVIVVSGLTEEQKKKYRILANKTNEFAGWDFEKLEQELSVLDFGEFDFGFEAGVPLATETEQKDLSDKVEGCFEVVVECIDETEQEQVFNKLTGDGYQCRVLTL